MCLMEIGKQIHSLGMFKSDNVCKFYCGCNKEGEKNSFVDPHWVTDIEENKKFGDLFENVAPVKAEDWCVTVKLGHKKPEEPAPKAFVSARLDKKLLLLSLQGANYVRFEIEKLGKNSFQYRKILAQISYIFFKLASTVEGFTLPPYFSIFAQRVKILMILRE